VLLVRLCEKWVKDVKSAHRGRVRRGRERRVLERDIAGKAGRRPPLLENVGFQPFLGPVPRLLGLWGSMGLRVVLLVHFRRGQVRGYSKVYQ